MDGGWPGLLSNFDQHAPRTHYSAILMSHHVPVTSSTSFPNIDIHVSKHLRPHTAEGVEICSGVLHSSPVTGAAALATEPRHL